MPADGLDDALAGAARGDEAATAVLYRALNPPLLRYLRHHVGRVAEDVASEVWLGLTPRLAGYGGTVDELRALMFSIAHRRVVDEYRRHRRRPPTVSLDDSFLVSSDRADAADTEATVVADVTAQGAVAALARCLPADQAEIVLLRVLGDLDAAEVAEIVGKSSAAVRIAQYRALQRLRRSWARKAVTR